MPNRDEHYVLDLCDTVLGMFAERQRRFTFLVGDPGRNGRVRQLPVDGFYEPIMLAIEYHERQHVESVPHFDKPNRLTVSGVHRGEQRKIYDQRRCDVLQAHGIALVVIRFNHLSFDSSARLKRKAAEDIPRIKRILAAYLPESSLS